MSELDEAHLYLKLIETLKEAASCARGMALMRSDPRWTGIAGGLEIMREGIGNLAGRKALSFGDGVRMIEKREKEVAAEASKKRLRERYRKAHDDTMREVIGQ